MTRQRAEQRLAEVEADLTLALEIGHMAWVDTLRRHRHWLKRKLDDMPTVVIAGRIGEDGPRAA